VRNTIASLRRWIMQSHPCTYLRHESVGTLASARSASARPARTKNAQPKPRVLMLRLV